MSATHPFTKNFWNMKDRPWPVLIVAILFLLVGLLGFSHHILDFFDPNEKVFDIVLVELLEILAIVCAMLLLRGKNSGRWLSIAWILIHVLISAFNSLSETMSHTVLLIVISVLLFLPASSRYFAKKSVH